MSAVPAITPPVPAITPAVPAITPAVPAVTAQDLELEHAELLPARETLMIGSALPRYYSPGGLNPGGPMLPPPDPFHVGWRE
jgi:hypothetical protein